MKLDVTDLQDVVDIAPRMVRRVARAALKGLEGCYSVVFVDDAMMTDINHRHLGRRSTTDVIAFAFDGAPLTVDDCAGEIIVSAELAAAEARKRGLAVEDELALYIAHGCLHVVGYDDATPDQAAEMHDRERSILAALGYDADRLWKPLTAPHTKSGGAS
jgi:probable rRNA maturation factor